jgi:hypothetical protein
MMAELHIKGMPKPFPFIYRLGIPSIGSKIIWEYVLLSGERHLLEARAAEIKHWKNGIYTLILEDFNVLAIIKDPTTHKTHMSNHPQQPQVYVKTVKGERSTCEIKVFLNSELLQLPPKFLGGDPVLEFGHRIEVAIPGTRPLVLTSTSNKLETAIEDAAAIAELFADKASANVQNGVIPALLSRSGFAEITK